MKPIPAAPAMSWAPRIIYKTWCSVSCVCEECLALDVKLDFSFGAQFLPSALARVLQREAA